MDAKTSSQSVSGSFKVEPDVDNLTDSFAGLACKQEEHPIVIFDLDTTKRDNSTNEIFQIAAWCKGAPPFNTCILPENIKEINGFRVVGGTLHHYGNEVNAVSPRQGLQFFLDFLRHQTGQTRGVLLAAHNCFASYRYIIIRLMKRYGLYDAFQALVLGFIDTVPVFKAILIDRPQEEGAFSLQNLATDYLGQNAYPERPHAGVNVPIIVLLNDTIGCTDAMLLQKAEGLDVSIRFIDLKQTFVLSDYILRKIARAGVSIENLIEVYRANGAAGVSIFLQRVALKPATIVTINDRLAELLGNGNAN